MQEKSSQNSLLLHQRFRFPVNAVDDSFHLFFAPERGHAQKQISAILLWKKVWENARYVCNTKDLTTRQPYVPAHWDEETRKVISISEEVIQEDWRSFRKEMFPRVRGVFEHFHEDVALLSGIMRNGLPTCAELPNGEIFIINFDKIESRNRKFLPTEIDASAKHEIALSDALDAIADRFDGKGIALEYILSLLSKYTDIVISAEPEDSLQYPSDTTQDIHQNYWDYRFFNDFAGRDTIVTSADGLSSILKSFKKLGHKEIFVKNTQTKGGVWRISLDKADDSIAMLHELLDKMKWLLLGNASFAVQPIVEFKNEYRFFIVAGEIIKGTPVRRSDCVYDDDDSLISPYICQRHDGYERVYAPAQVARYQALVEEMLKVAKDDIKSDNLSIVIDVGEDEDGLIFPIEVNTVMRAGAYGFNHAKLIDHLVKVAARV